MTFDSLRKRVRLSLRDRRFRPWGEIEEYGRKNATYCDYDDGHEAPDRGSAGANLLSLWKAARCIGARPEWVRYDATRRGYHVVTRWNRNFDPSQTVALQLLLGSDPAREAFNLARVMSPGETSREGKRWNILYRLKLTK